MKKRYQIDRQDAVRKFRQHAQESEQELQLQLPPRKSPPHCRKASAT